MTASARALVRQLRSAYSAAKWALSYERLLRDAQSPDNPRVTARFDLAGTAFIHIPKNGGNSVAAALYGKSVGHRTWRDLQRLHPSALTRWLTLAIVREPVDRFLSAYDYLMGGGRTGFDRAFRRRFMRGRPSIAAFVSEQFTLPKRRARMLAWFHFRPQCDYVADASGRVVVQRLIPFDRLDEMLPPLLPDGAVVPRLNVTKGPRTTREQIPPETLATIQTIYARDAALFRLAHGAAGADVRGTILEASAGGSASLEVRTGRTVPSRAAR